MHLTQGYNGGAIYLDGSSPIFNRVNITNNSSSDVGGGIFCVYNSDPVISQSVFYDNYGLDGNMEHIYLAAGDDNNITISYSSLTSLTDSITVIDNSTVSDLGGIIDVDPLFINPQEKNFTILASSQLVNAGHPDSLDSDGSRADIGANPYLNDYSGPNWFISENGNNVDASGSSEDPFSSIQAGINFSSAGDSILVSAGTYIENINMRSKVVNVVGEDLSTTIIDGNGNGSVVTFMNDAQGALLKNFTIQNGNAIYQPSWASTFGAAGGGIRMKGSRPVLENILIKDNTAAIGGGIYYHGGNLSNPVRTIFKNVVITQNTAAKGGGIYCQDDVNEIFEGLTIINNIATDQNGGGGINSNWNSPVTIINSIITGNQPEQLAINGSQCSFTIAYSNIQGGQDSIYVSDVENNQIHWQNGNIDIDSKMQNVEEENFNLLASSMLINAGHPDSLDSDGTRKI